MYDLDIAYMGTISQHTVIEEFDKVWKTFKDFISELASLFRGSHSNLKTQLLNILKRL
jgi:hypothetical protein